MTLDFSPDTALMAVADHACCAMGGEAVVLNLDTGTYYGLDSVGTRAWELLQQPRSLAELRDLIAEEFDVTPDRCEADLLSFVASLSAHGLVQPCDAARR
jgi:hypothetical protein